MSKKFQRRKVLVQISDERKIGIKVISVA